MALQGRGRHTQTGEWWEDPRTGQNRAMVWRQHGSGLHLLDRVLYLILLSEFVCLPSRLHFLNLSFFLSSGSFLWGSILDFYRNLLFVSFWAVTQDLGPAYTPGGQPPCYEPLPPLSWMLQRHHLKILNEFLTRSTRFSWGFGSHRFYTCPIDRI